MHQTWKQKQEKNNCCDPDGDCTLEYYSDEVACAFYAEYSGTGLCAFRAWQGQCLSPKALDAARISTQVGSELSVSYTAVESSGNAVV
jgi:hypothetical protein